MSNFEYSSYSSASNTGGAGNAGGAGGGFDVAKAIFNQADANHDGAIDRNEFQQWAANSGGNNAGAGSQYDPAGGAGGNFEQSSFESSSYASGGAAGGAYGAEAGFTGATSPSSFEGASYGGGAGLEASAASGGQFQASSSSTFEAGASGANVAGYDSAAVTQAASYTAETNAAWSKYGAEVRGAGLFFDTNPQIIRRPASGGVQTYTQNIKVRFLQPPPIPPPGVSVTFYYLFLSL
jgi:hypothetical protein